jgi:hypothetical protein
MKHIYAYIFGCPLYMIYQIISTNHERFLWLGSFDMKDTLSMSCFGHDHFVLGLELPRVFGGTHSGNKLIILIHIFYMNIFYIQNSHPWRHGNIMNFCLGSWWAVEYFHGLESWTCVIHWACPTMGLRPPCGSPQEVKDHLVWAPCHPWP